MTRKPNTTPPTPTCPALDVPGVLSRARRELWRLQTEGAAVNPDAARAVTGGRHGDAGKRFADSIINAVGIGASEAEILAAIERGLIRA